MKKDERVLKIGFTKGGSGSVTNKIGLPSTWIRDMGITPDDREVVVNYNEETQEITIKKILSKSYNLYA